MEKPSRQKRGSLFCFQAFVPLFQQCGQSKQENDVKLKAAECWEFYSLSVSVCQQRHNGQHDFHLSACTELDSFLKFASFDLSFIKIDFLGVGALRAKSDHEENRHDLQPLRRHQKGEKYQKWSKCFHCYVKLGFHRGTSARW